MEPRSIIIITLIVALLYNNARLLLCEPTHLSYNDFTHALLDDYVIQGGQDVLEQGNFFQGDLKDMNQSDIDDLIKGSFPLPEGKPRVILGIRETNKRSLWPGGRMPYYIDSVFSAAERATIARGIEEIQRETCLRIVPASAFDQSHIFIHKAEGCWSNSLGMRKSGGRHLISLGNGCVYLGIVIHELLHMAGFYHEHQRPDRDQYVNILFDNIDPKWQYPFDKVGNVESSTLGEPYDYSSIMHYGKTGFAKSRGLITIDAKNNEIGQRDGLSLLDIRKIKKLYQCDGPCNDIPPPGRWVGGLQNAEYISHITCYPTVQRYETLTCKQQVGLGKCDFTYFPSMKGFCRRSCGLCTGGNPPVCNDQPPPPGIHSCEQLKVWGRCRAYYMQGYCEIACGTCQAY